MKRFLVFILAFFFLGCSSILKKNILAPVPEASERYCLLFVVDGLRGDHARRWLRLGLLPNFKKHIYDRGLWVDHATSIFPSVTAAAMTSVMTGVYPGRHNVANFQWIDRNTGKYKSYIGTDIVDFVNDMNPDVKTIFQYFPKEETASFGFLMDKGAGHADSLMFTALNPFRGLSPHMHVAISELFSLFKGGKSFPRLMAFYEWEVDVRGHRQGSWSKETFQALQQADENFGRLVSLYQQRGIYDQTYFVLISDHGMARVKKRFNVDRYLEEHGFKTRLISWNLGESHIPSDWDRVDSLLGTTKKVYDSDSVVGAAGGGCAAIEFVANGGVPSSGEKTADLWKKQLTYSDLRHAKTKKGEEVDVIDLLCRAKAVDFMLVRDDADGQDGERRIRVVNQKGETLLRRMTLPGKGFVYKYQVLQGKDPLSLADEHQIRPLVDSGRFYEEKTWYQALQNEDYPDAVVQFCQIFDSSRAPTVILCAAEYWSFNSQIVGKHAGALEEEMRATFSLSGPGIAKQELSQARIVDMVPTVLKLMGVKFDPEKLDGRSIF